MRLLVAGAPEAPEPPDRVERCAKNPANTNNLLEPYLVAFFGEREVRKCLDCTIHALWFARVGRVPRIFGSGLVSGGAACAANNSWRMVESVAGGARVSGAVVRASQCQFRQRLILQAVATASQRDSADKFPGVVRYRDVMVEARTLEAHTMQPVLCCGNGIIVGEQPAALSWH